VAGDYGPDTAPTAWEAALADAYDRDGEGPTGPTSDAADAHSAVLHLADFLHPLTAGYEQVVIALGVDEHALTLGTRRFLADAPVEGTVAGLHARLVPGLGDYPKMSKSIPGSGVTLAMDPETVRERVREADTDPVTAPEASPVFTMMCLASPYGPDELDRLEHLHREGGEEWAAARAAYADYLAGLGARWGESV
jgi:tryptophanyl-tRNA synthetase